MNQPEDSYDCILIGGGLAGLCSAISLRLAGFQILLLEKNHYPKHKVCGEYVSKEVTPYLQFLGINMQELKAKALDKLHFSTQKGLETQIPLPMGGWGISRYALDLTLYNRALELGVKVAQDEVTDIHFENNQFQISTKSNKVYFSKTAIGTHGKRSKLDQTLQRSFISNRSAYMAVKRHVELDFPEDVVGLHNFDGGYCGVSKVETNAVNICYISSFKSFQHYKNIAAFEEKVVAANPILKTIFSDKKECWEKPLVISQISFETKECVVNHALMAGDAAGMIHPLSGNGMGMAIRSAQLASNETIQFLKGITTRSEMERKYTKAWKRNFLWRLRAGRIISGVFRIDWLADRLLRLLRRHPALLILIIKSTHGKLMKGNIDGN
ncbi:MAG: FAD-dependent monooxygenase [Chitinophagaceae bacterium]